MYQAENAENIEYYFSGVNYFVHRIYKFSDGCDENGIGTECSLFIRLLV